jgi:hypothetical protein
MNSKKEGLGIPTTSHVGISVLWSYQKRWQGTSNASSLLDLGRHLKFRYLSRRDALTGSTYATRIHLVSRPGQFVPFSSTSSPRALVSWKNFCQYNVFWSGIELFWHCYTQHLPVRIAIAPFLTLEAFQGIPYRHIKSTWMRLCRLFLSGNKYRFDT